jgi:CMP/dCMP kinase
MGEGSSISGINHAIMHVSVDDAQGSIRALPSRCFLVSICRSIVMCMSFLTCISLNVHACFHVDMLKPMIIAIDGPAASGKGTIAKQVAAIYGLPHLDTGLIYRAVAKAVLDAGYAPDNVEKAIDAAIALDPTQFDESALKAPAITEAASVVAAIPEVRQALMNYQRGFATKPPGAVLDGRDIGTVIAPGADVKIFVVATPEVRAARRTAEMRARGEPADEKEVLADLLRRDERDSRRTAAPLKAAPDAHLLATTHLGIDAAFRAAVDIIEAVRTGRKR